LRQVCREISTPRYQFADPPGASGLLPALLMATSVPVAIAIAYILPRERGCIVDAVANHRHTWPLSRNA